MWWRDPFYSFAIFFVDINTFSPWNESWLNCREMQEENIEMLYGQRVREKETEREKSLVKLQRNARREHRTALWTEREKETERERERERERALAMWVVVTSGLNWWILKVGCPMWPAGHKPAQAIHFETPTNSYTKHASVY